MVGQKRKKKSLGSYHPAITAAATFIGSVFFRDFYLNISLFSQILSPQWPRLLFRQEIRFSAKYKYINKSFLKVSLPIDWKILCLVCKISNMAESTFHEMHGILPGNLDTKQRFPSFFVFSFYHKEKYSDCRRDKNCDILKRADQFLSKSGPRRHWLESGVCYAGEMIQSKWISNYWPLLMFRKKKKDITNSSRDIKDEATSERVRLLPTAHWNEILIFSSNNNCSVYVWLTNLTSIK